MVRFACEWCGELKRPEEVWIMGYAAENLGTTAARREVTVMSGWDYQRAVHPFAVHFCSVEHKDNYVSALFDTTPLPLVKEVVKTKKKRVVPQEKLVVRKNAGKRRRRA